MKPSNSILYWRKYFKSYFTNCDLDLLFRNTPTTRIETACKERDCTICRQLNWFFAAITLPRHTYSCLWQRQTTTTVPLYRVNFWTIKIQRNILNETYLQPLTMCLWSLFHCRDKESGAMLSTTANWETKVRWTRMTPYQFPVKAYCSHSALVTAPSTTVRCADRWWSWIVRNQSAVLHLLMRRNHHPVKKTRQQLWAHIPFCSGKTTCRKKYPPQERLQRSPSGYQWFISGSKSIRQPASYTYF